MAEIDIGRLKAELIAGGFRPQRFAFLVNKIRRVLWPLVRPYHFFTLEALGAELDRRLAENAGALQRLIRRSRRSACS